MIPKKLAPLDTILQRLAARSEADHTTAKGVGRITLDPRYRRPPGILLSALLG